MGLPSCFFFPGLEGGETFISDPGSAHIPVDYCIYLTRATVSFFPEKNLNKTPIIIRTLKVREGKRSQDK